MEIVNALVEAYARQYSSPEDDALRKIAENTSATHPKAHMLSGHLQGKFLQFISDLMQPFSILEIGTFTGYSSIALAGGLKPGGKLHTIELRPEDADVALTNFNLSGLQDKIILHRGNALEIIPALREQWDLVFIDADKVNYIAYYNLVLPKLRKGGVIVADNVLFHGQVLQEPLTGKNAKAIHAFNEFVRDDNRVEKLVLTIRDGLLLIIKK